MLFNFEEQQINPAESTNNFSPLCVLVFYNEKTEFISRLMQDNESGRLRSDYPGFSFLIMKRRRDYSNPSFSDIAEHTLAARLIPAKDEKVSTFLVTQKNEDKVLNEGGEACSVSLYIFMIKLQEKNAERASTYGSKLDDISAFVQQNLPQFAETSEQVIARMTQLFQSESDRAISNAQTVTLRLVKTQPTERRVGTHVEYERVTMERYWGVELVVDEHSYTIPFGRRVSMKAIFVYMMLHPNTNISEESIKAKEVSLIIKTLYPQIEDDAIKSIRNNFGGTSFSRQIGKMKRIAVAPDEYLSVAPFEWISKIEDRPLGNPNAALWIFSPPAKVTIDTESFRQAMNEV